MGKSFASPFIKVKYLKLDDNLIGSEGLKNLCEGLKTNSSVTKLSLKYCGIDLEGAQYIQNILANLSSQIRSIKLQGNQLTNKGIHLVLRAV